MLFYNVIIWIRVPSHTRHKSRKWYWNVECLYVIFSKDATIRFQVWDLALVKHKSFNCIFHKLSLILAEIFFKTLTNCFSRYITTTTYNMNCHRKKILYLCCNKGLVNVPSTSWLRTISKVYSIKVLLCYTKKTWRWRRIISIILDLIILFILNFTP